MSGIMSMFSNLMGGGNQAPAAAAPGATVAATQPANPGSIPPNAPATGVSTPNAAPNGVLPGNQDANPAPAPTHFAEFQDLWKTPESSGEKKPTGVFGDIDPKKFMEAAGKIDFAKVITPDQLQAISSGGENAVKAFAAALNSVAQTTYAQSAFAATKISEQAIAKARESLMGEISGIIRQQTVSENLRQENPIFSNPAVNPVISALEQQLVVKYPNASTHEITSMAKKYVENLASAFAPAAPANTKPGNSRQVEETDWSKFLEA